MRSAGSKRSSASIASVSGDPAIADSSSAFDPNVLHAYDIITGPDGSSAFSMDESPSSPISGENVNFKVDNGAV